MKTNTLKIAARSASLSSSFAVFCKTTDTEFLADCRTLLKGTGYRLKLRGRGPRTQPALRENGWPRSFDQSLPLEHAAYYAVYVEKSGPICTGGQSWEDCMNAHQRGLSNAAGMVLAAAKIYSIYSREIAA